MLVYRRVVTHFVVQPHPRRSRSSRLATAALTSWDKGLQTPDPSWAYFILKYEYEQIYSTISMYMLHVYIHIFRCIYIYIIWWYHTQSIYPWDPCRNTSICDHEFLSSTSVEGSGQGESQWWHFNNRQKSRDFLYLGNNWLDILLIMVNIWLLYG